jgi:hypothetical protein
LKSNPKIDYVTQKISAIQICINLRGGKINLNSFFEAVNLDENKSENVCCKLLFVFDAEFAAIVLYVIKENVFQHTINRTF